MWPLTEVHAITTMSPTSTPLNQFGIPGSGLPLAGTRHVTPLTVTPLALTADTFPEIRITCPECGVSSAAAETHELTVGTEAGHQPLAVDPCRRHDPRVR